MNQEDKTPPSKMGDAINFALAISEGAEARRLSQLESIENPPPGSVRVQTVGKPGNEVTIRSITPAK